MSTGTPFPPRLRSVGREGTSDRGSASRRRERSLGTALPEAEGLGLRQRPESLPPGGRLPRREGVGHNRKRQRRPAATRWRATVRVSFANRKSRWSSRLILAAGVTATAFRLTRDAPADGRTSNGLTTKPVPRTGHAQDPKWETGRGLGRTAVCGHSSGQGRNSSSKVSGGSLGSSGAAGCEAPGGPRRRPRRLRASRSGRSVVSGTRSSSTDVEFPVSTT